MSIYNRRNAVLGWTVWTLTKNVARQKAKKAATPRTIQRDAPSERERCGAIRCGCVPSARSGSGGTAARKRSCSQARVLGVPSELAAPDPRLFRPALEPIAPYEGGKPVEELARELGPHAGQARLERESARAEPACARGRAPSARRREPLSRRRRVRAPRSYRAVSWRFAGRGAARRGLQRLLGYVARTFATPEHHIVFGGPAFIVYRIAALSGGVPFTAVPLKNHVHDFAGHGRSPSRRKASSSANPNNPTGTHASRSAVEELLKTVPPGR